MKFSYLNLLFPKVFSKFYYRKFYYFFKSLYYGFIRGHYSSKIYFENWKQENLNRHALINAGVNRIYIEKGRCNYLEIGCNKNQNFNSIALTRQEKTGVDPVQGGNILSTSDEFFKNNKKKFDVIFVDGLHHYEQCQKDILNSLKFIDNYGIIFIHDLLPRNWKIEHVPRLNDNWTGDIWKVAVEIHNSENLDFYIANIDSGVGCVFVKPNYKYKSMNNKLKNTNYNDFIKNIKNCKIIEPDFLLKVIREYKFFS